MRPRPSPSQIDQPWQPRHPPKTKHREVAPIVGQLCEETEKFHFVSDRNAQLLLWVQRVCEASVGADPCGNGHHCAEKLLR